MVDHKVSDPANVQYLVQLGKPIVEKDQEVIFTLFDGEMAGC